MQYIFEAEIAVKAVGGADGSPWLVEGPVAAPGFDYDKERLEPDGVHKGLDMFDSMGSQVDFEHKYRATHDPKYIIGVGVARRLEDGIPYLRTELFNSENKPLAKSVWQHLNTRDSNGNPGYGGYSVEGRVLERDSHDKRIIKAVEIHRVTISMTPKGLGQTRVVPIAQVVKAVYGDEEALKGFAIEDGALEHLTSIFQAENVEVPRYGALAHILKAYTTGNQIVTPGVALDASALRSQAFVAQPVVKKPRRTATDPATAPSPKPAVPAVKKSLSPRQRVDEARAERLLRWEQFCAARGLSKSCAEQFMRKMEAL